MKRRTAESFWARTDRAVIAGRFGISRSQVYRIGKRIDWGWL